MKKKKYLGKWILSLSTIIIVLISLIASSFYFDISDNPVTGNIVLHSSFSTKEISMEDLQYLNEGFYSLRNGYLYYFQDFDAPVPLYTRVVDADYQGRFSVDENGIVDLMDDYDEIKEQENSITGEVTGMEKVSGMETATPERFDPTKATNWHKKDGTYYAVYNNNVWSKPKGGTWTKGEPYTPTYFTNTYTRITPSFPTSSQSASPSPTSSKTYTIINPSDPDDITEIEITPRDTKKPESRTQIRITDSNGNERILTSPGFEDDKIDWSKYDASKSTEYPLKGGGTRRIIGNILSDTIKQGDIETFRHVEFYPDGKTKVESKTTTNTKNGAKTTIETEFYDDGKTAKKQTETRTETKNGQQQSTSKTTEYFPDKSTKIITRTNDGVTEKIDIAFTYGKRKLTLTNEEYSNFQSLGKDRDRFLRIAAREGIDQIKPGDFDKNVLTSGNRKILFLPSQEGKDIIVSDKDGKVLTQYTERDGVQVRRVYSGNVRLNAFEGFDGTLVKGSSYNEYDENGKLIGRKEVSKDGKVTEYRFNALTNEFEIESEESGYLRIREKNKDGTYTVKIGDKEGNFDGDKLIGDDGKEIKLTDEEKKALIYKLNVLRKAQGLPSMKQEKAQQFFANLEQTFTQFRGLSYFATFFQDKEFFIEWRETVDKFFAEAYLGTEYWTSAICECDLGSFNAAGVKCVKPKAGEGVAYAESPSGLLQVGAHIEATRTQPMINQSNEKEYIYMITFRIKNGIDNRSTDAPKNMTFNVILRGQKETKLFKSDQSIGRGSTYTKAGTSAIVKATKNVYDTICIKFDKIPSKWKLDNNQLCNKIIESSGEPVKLPTQSSASSSSSRPNEETNDI